MTSQGAAEQVIILICVDVMHRKADPDVAVPGLLHWWRARAECRPGPRRSKPFHVTCFFKNICM